MSKEKIFIIIISVTFLIGCNNIKKPVYNAISAREEPVIDGQIDDVWNKAEAAFLHYYYGELPKDTLDFKAYFKVIKSEKNLFFLVDVTDQVKYTHPKPQCKFDMTLWDLNDYDRVNLSFDSDNNGKIEIDKNDIGISMNYNIDSVFTYNISNQDITTKLKDTSSGYIVEFKIPLKYFKTNKIACQVRITDHDRKFDKKDFDVFARWESEFGWGINKFNQDINKRFGFLKIN